MYKLNEEGIPEVSDLKNNHEVLRSVIGKIGGQLIKI